MNFRPITLRKMDGKILEFRPENIQTLEFKEDTVILQYWQEPCPMWTTKIILKKEDCHYPHWRYFIGQLTRIFEIEEHD